MIRELKACPFCGKEGGRVREKYDADEIRWINVECAFCGASTRGKWSNDPCPLTYVEVRDEWNTRAAIASATEQGHE